jgi:hypothetical protein
MDLDGLIRRQADVLLASRLCAYLLKTPLATIPLTILIDWGLLGVLGVVRERSFGDVILLHLPGLANLYPLYRMMQLGRVSRTLLLPSMLGLLSYSVPQCAWFVFVSGWRTLPPPVEAPILVVAMVIQSSFYSLILWFLTFSVYRSYRDTYSGA